MKVIFNKSLETEKIYEIDSYSEKLQYRTQFQNEVPRQFISLFKEFSIENPITTHEFFADVLRDKYVISSIDVVSDDEAVTYVSSNKYLYIADCETKGEATLNTIAKYGSIRIYTEEDIYENSI